MPIFGLREQKSWDNTQDQVTGGLFDAIQYKMNQEKTRYNEKHALEENSVIRHPLFLFSSLLYGY